MRIQSIFKVLRFSLLDFFSEKSNFILYFTVIFLYQLLYIVFLRVIFLKVPAIYGLKFSEVLVIFGIFQVVSGLFHLAFAYLIWFQEKYIWSRNLDVILTLPSNPILYITLKEIPGQIMEIITVITGIVIMATGFVTGGGISILGLVKIIIATLLGFLILSGFAYFLVSISFLLYGRRSVFEAFYEVLELGQYPITIYPKSLRVIFTFLIPIGFLATYPYLSLYKTQMLIFMFIASLFFLISGYVFFHYFLKYYQSGG